MIFPMEIIGDQEIREMYEKQRVDFEPYGAWLFPDPQKPMFRTAAVLSVDGRTCALKESWLERWRTTAAVDRTGSGRFEVGGDENVVRRTAFLNTRWSLLVELCTAVRGLPGPFTVWSNLISSLCGIGDDSLLFTLLTSRTIEDCPKDDEEADFHHEKTIMDIIAELKAGFLRFDDLRQWHVRALQDISDVAIRDVGVHLPSMRPNIHDSSW